MDFGTTELVYRAEGNANLVVYLPEYKKVLRLQKTQLKASNTTTNKENDNNNTLDIHKRFAYMNFINGLIGLEYSCKLEIVMLTQPECERIKTICTPFRPSNRLDKEIIGQFGLLMSDATLMCDLSQSDNTQQIENFQFKDTFAIEIKTKQGWMVHEIQEKIPGVFKLNEFNKCRYCSMQYLKLKQGKLDRISKFCPMDVFSGDCNRIINAISALFEYPQNNLRIFKNGFQCYGDYIDSIPVEKLNEDVFGNQEDFYKKLIATCLLNKYKNNLNEIERNINNNNLPQGSVLHTLFTIQTLARDNIAFMVNKEYKKEISYDYLSELLNKRDCKSLNELTAKEKYMLGATAMDSSIMISFSELTNHRSSNEYLSNNIIEIDDRHFFTQVKILDIDPKSDNHFQKYVTQTNEAYYATFLHLTNESNNMDN